MPYAQASGARIAYQSQGSAGTPVLLIMGFNMPGRAWRHQIDDLSEGHRVAWFDNRGVGRSVAAPKPFRMAQLADDTASVLDALGWDDAHLVGVSMGGMIAQHVALRHRDRVRSLSLIATHPGGLRAALPPTLGLKRFLRASSGKNQLAAVERLLFPDAYLATWDRTRLREGMIDDFTPPGPHRFRMAQLAAIARHNTRNSLKHLAGIPALVIKPTEDILVDPRGSDRLAQGIPGATLLEIPGAGHGLVRQVPEILNPALLAHFAQRDLRSGPD